MRISYPALGAIGGSLLASSALAQTAPAAPAPPAAAGTAATSDPLAAQLEALLGRPVYSDPAKNISLFDFSYGEPGSPVLPLVGVEADQISRVESLRRFGLSLLPGIGSGQTAPAMGIDFSPFWLLARGPISLESYRNMSGSSRIFARTKIAAAASRGNEASALPSSLVFSLSTKLLGSQDPLTNDTFPTCVQGELRTLLDRARQAGSDASSQVQNDMAEEADSAATAGALQQMGTEVSGAYQTCANLLAMDLARHASFDVGGGFRLTGEPGHFRQFQGSGFVLWGTYATGVLGGGGNSGGMSSALGMQIRGIVHGRYTFAEDFYDQKGVRTGQADSALLVAGLESVPASDNPSPFQWSLQAGWTRQDAPDATTEDRNYWRFLGIARYRLGERLWLNGTVGRVQGRGVESDDYVAIGFSIAPAAGSPGIDNFYRRAR